MVGPWSIARRAVCGMVLALLLLLPVTARAQIMDDAIAGPPAPPQVTAVAALVMDPATGAILWGQNIHAPRAPASDTKMMTALVVMDLATLDRKVTTQESDLVGESSMGLESGETLTVEALLYGMLLPSGNDAATALARTFGTQPGDTTAEQSVGHFVDKMNAKARTLGATETHFANPHGLDEPNHVTSAADLALIARAFAANPTLMRIAGTVTYDGFGHTVHTTNKLLYDGRFPAVVAGKTGQTDEAGYNLVEIAAKNGRRMLSVELGTTAESFWTDAMHLLAFGYATSPAPRATAMEVQHRAPREQKTPLPTAAGPATGERVTAGVQRAPLADDRAPTDAAESPAVVTIPLPNRPNNGMAIRVVVYSLMGAMLCAFVYRKRPALRWALGEMRREWYAALADPPHLVVTAPMPVVARDPTVAPSLSSRWEAMGASLPKPEIDVAQAYALQAVRQANQGTRAAAQQAFARAVGLNPRLDWGAVPGFWEIPPASYADLATTLLDAGHASIARSMLTVAALAHPRHPDLRAIEARLNPRPPGPHQLRIIRPHGQ